MFSGKTDELISAWYATERSRSAGIQTGDRPALRDGEVTSIRALI